MTDKPKRRCVAIYRTKGGQAHRVAEFVNEDGGPVELRILSREFEDETSHIFEGGFGSVPPGHRVTAADGDEFLDGALNDLSGTYWRAVEEEQ